MGDDRERRLVPAGLEFGHLRVEPGLLVVHASTGHAPAECPCCGRGCPRVHSRYVRTVADLPWHGVAIRLRVRSRRMFCENAACERRIFCERLPKIDARARKTDRLEEALLAVALELGGRAGARLAEELGIVAARDTLLRRIKGAPLPEVGKVGVLGVDDFAFKKGSTYHARHDLAKRSAGGRAPRGRDRRGTPPLPARGRPLPA